MLYGVVPMVSVVRTPSLKWNRESLEVAKSATSLSVSSSGIMVALGGTSTTTGSPSAGGISVPSPDPSGVSHVAQSVPGRTSPAFLRRRYILT